MLHDQIAYYQRRAHEYDETAYGSTPDRPDSPRVLKTLDRLQVSGDVLEIACGTGMWTSALAREASFVLGVDASDAALAKARERCAGLDHVAFERADVLTWHYPALSFDTILAAFWLSHVPPSMLEGHLRDVLAGLRRTGSLHIIDEPTENRHSESWDTTAGAGVVRRTLADGSQHRVLKFHLEPRAMSDVLTRVGFHAISFDTTDDWIVISAQRPA